MVAKDKTPREHILLKPLRETINGGFIKGSSPEEILESVMRTLDQQKMISYCSKEEISLLSPAGRVLVAIMEDSSITQRALSVYLGVTESNIQKSIKVLIDAKLITKTKIKGRNNYRIEKSATMQHSDISRFYDGITKNISTQSAEDDESPF